MDIKQIRLHNLDALIQEADGKRQLAQRVGIKPNYLSQVHTRSHFEKDARGATRALRYVGSKMARKLEAAMNKSRGWMDQIHESDGGLRGLPTQRAAILTWVEACRVKLMSAEEFLTKDATIHVGENTGSRLFALYVQNDHMVDSAAKISFPEGSLIIVDPDRKAEPEDFVIVRVPGHATAILRQLVHDGLRPLLKPLNSRYPLDQMPDGAEILGVVIGMQIDITPRAHSIPILPTP